MIKKRIYYLVVNGSDASPLSMEAYDILNAEEMRLCVAHELRSPVAYVRVMSQRDHILSVFSVLDYIAEQDVSLSASNFTSFVNEVQRYIQSIPIHELFWVWISQFDPSLTMQHRTDINTILERYALPFSYDDLATLRQDWDVQIESRKEDMQMAYQRTMEVYDHLFEYQCDSKDILPFAIRKTRIKFDVVYDHSLYYMMDALRLDGEWCVAVYKDLVRYHPSMTSSLLETYDEGYVSTLQERIEDRGEDGEVDALIILHKDLEQGIRIQRASSQFQVWMDVIPFDEIDPMRKVLKDLIGVEPSQHYETMSISGNFYIKHVAFQKLIFQDFLMNDPIASKVMYVNELEKAYRYGDNVTVHFGNSLTAILINRRNDTTPVPSSLSYFQGNYVKINVLRATGSQQNLNIVTKFQEIVCVLLHRFMRLYNDYHALYYDVLKTTPTFPVLVSDEPVQEIRNFADKYKNIFKHTGYKTSCRPKTRMPTIVSEDQAKTLNPLKVIKFPKANDPKLDIPSEYLTCDDPAYPFPGIVSLGGGDLFVPCCFNKNPRSSRAFLEYYQGIKTTEPKGTEHIKSESQIIKTFGDVGRLPPFIHQFLIAIRPDMTFLRAGTIDSTCSILHSLSYMVGKTEVPVSDSTTRRQFASFFGDNLAVCQAENGGMSIDQIKDHLQDISYPLDPRRYFRLLETFYNVNLVIFVRTKKKEDFEILTPFSRHFYLRYDFDPSKPFVFLYEHWGTSPDRYTKRLHSVYEMIVSVPDSPSDRPMTTTFDLNASQRSILTKVYRTLFHVYPLTQNLPLLRINPSVRGQILDDYGRLRTLIVQKDRTSKEYFAMECTYPLPALYIPNQLYVTMDEIQRMYKTLPSEEEVLRASPFRTVKIVKYLQYRRQQYIVMDVDGTYQFKVAIRSTSDALQGGRSALPLMTKIPSLKQPPSIDIVRKKQLARVLMDYTLYLYATFFYQDDPSAKEANDDYASFFRTRALVVPDYEYPVSMSERVDGNPGIMDTSTNMLYLDSDVLQQKLMYVLKYHRYYESSSLLSYRNLTLLPAFWEVPYDFRSWKEMQSISNFERFLRTGYLLPYHVERTSLDELSNDHGYWYNHDQRPVTSWSCPFRYVHIEHEEDAVPLTLYWRKYRAIPSFRVTDAVSSTDNVSIMRYEPMEGWVPNPSGMDPNSMELVFQVRNRNGQVYVLLEMKN